MKKLIRLFAVIIILFTLLTNVSFSAIDPQKAILFRSSTQIIDILKNCTSHYYKNTLKDPKEIELYEEIQTALYYRIDNYKISFSDTNTLNKIALFVCLDNPFFTLTNSFYTTEVLNPKNSLIDKINSGKLPFVFNDQNYYEKMIKTYEKATQIILQMPEFDNEYDKIKYLHDYMITNVRYTKNTDNSDADTAYGALIGGKARCEGYTNAFSILLNLAKIENAKVFYFGEDNQQTDGHIWNIAKINNQYYHIDTTNDSFSDENDIPSNYTNYTYFLISSEDIKKTSQINSMIADLIPACDSENDNFFIKNQLYFTYYSRLNVGKAAGLFLADQDQQGLNGVSIKFKNKSDYDKMFSDFERSYLLSVIADYANSDAMSFSCYMNDDQQVITFFPQ